MAIILMAHVRLHKKSFNYLLHQTAAVFLLVTTHFCVVIAEKKQQYCTINRNKAALVTLAAAE